MSGNAGNTSGGSQQFKPPGYAKPYDIELLQKGSQIANTPFTPYGGQMVAGFNPMQQQGFNLANMYGNQGAGLAGAGGQQLYNTLSGANLGGNPYLDQVVNQSNQDIANQYRYATAPGNMALASRSGSLDNTGVAGKDMMDQYSLAKALAGNEANLRYGNYAQERQNQVNAINPALNYGQTTLGGLNEAGATQQQNAQQQLQAQYSEFQRQLGYPQEQLGALQNALGTAQGNFGVTSNKSPNPSPWMYPLAVAGSFK